MNDISDLISGLNGASLSSSILNSRQEILAPVQPVSSFPKIGTIENLLEDKTPEPPRLIEGLLHKGCKMVIGGDSKACKSWSLLDLGLSVAAGEPWWGMKTSKTKVLYVNMELPTWTLRQRLQLIFKARPELEAAMANFDIWSLRGHANGIDDFLKEFVAQVNTQYGLVILDPIYKLYGDKDENSASDMAGLLNVMDTMIDHSGAAVVFSAHFSKGNKANKQAMDRISGSGVFARDPDSILTLTPHQDADTLVVESSLRCFKRLEPFCVKWEAPLLRVDKKADPGKLKRLGGNGPKYSTEQLLNVLGCQELTNKEWKEACVEATKMSERTFDGLRKQLVDDEIVSKDADGKYSLSDKGLTAITAATANCGSCSS